MSKAPNQLIEVYQRTKDNLDKPFTIRKGNGVWECTTRHIEERDAVARVRHDYLESLCGR